MRRRALLAASQTGGGDSDLFPVYLILGDNGELGISVFNYFKENYSFGIHSLDDNTQVYINNESMSEVLVTATVTFDGSYVLLTNGIIISNMGD